MVEVVDEKDGAQLLGLEGPGQLHEQIHTGIPHAVQIMVQLPILYYASPVTLFAAEKGKVFVRHQRLGYATIPAYMGYT